MKHTLQKCAAALAALGSLLLSSCINPIFYYINQEVALEDYGIVGDISGIVEQGDWLFVNSGHIYKKKAGQSSATGVYNKGWSRAGSEPGTMYGLASDGTNLYSLKVAYSEDTSTGTNSVVSLTLYCSADGGASWEAVSGADGITALVQDRKAGKGYAKKSGGLYKLSGKAVGSQLSGSVAASKSASNGKAFAGASVYSDKHIMYYMTDSSGADIYYSSDGTLGSKVSPGIGTIESLDVTSDYLIVGTSAGIHRVKLGSGGTPASSTTAFSNNAQAIMSSSYEVPRVFVLDQSKAEQETDIYAATNISGAFSSSSHATFSSVGLYAYYPGRGTWNRDGTNDGSTTPKGN